MCSPSPRSRLVDLKYVQLLYSRQKNIPKRIEINKLLRSFSCDTTLCLKFAEPPHRATSAHVKRTSIPLSLNGDDKGGTSFFHITRPPTTTFHNTTTTITLMSSLHGVDITLPSNSLTFSSPPPRPMSPHTNRSPLPCHLLPFAPLTPQP